MVEIVNGTTSMRKFWLPIIYGIVGLAAITYAGHRAYVHWEPEHLVNLAREAFEKKDFTGAELQLRRALQLNPGSVAATRFAAEMLEAGNSPEAVKFRAHVLDLAPHSTDDKLAWLAAALKFNQPAEARKAMASFTPAERNTAIFESYSGALEASLAHFEEAGQHYAAAMKLDPKDDLLRFNYASMQLHSRNPEIRQAGIATMKSLGKDSRFSSQSQRSLIAALISSGNLADALTASASFESTPGAEFEDRMTHLDLMNQLHKPGESIYLTNLEFEAAKTPRNAGTLISWLNAHGKARNAIAWSNALSKTVIAAPECGAPLASCYMALRDWTNLRDLTRQADWKQFEFLRFALLTRAYEEMGVYDGVEPAWKSAVSAAADNKASLGALRQMFTEWGPKYERELNAVFLALGEKWGDMKALRYLYGKYAQVRDTAQLCKITKLIVDIDPSNRDAANNYAMFSMLCKQNIPEAARIAHDLYDSDHTNAAFASTYAFGLYSQGYAAQGLKLMESLDPAELKKPEIATYYGILLAANDMPEKAIDFLKIAETGSGMLPEEKELVEAALKDSASKIPAQ